MNIAGSVQLNKLGRKHLDYYGSLDAAYECISKNNWKSSGGPLPVDDTVYISNS
jgi:hypothetical protein